MDAVGTLGVALVGGSAGALITLVAGLPEQVRDHDRSVAEYDQDLGQWISDEMVRLEREVERIKNRQAREGQLYSGAYLRAIAHAKEAALHAYRDQEIAAERKRADVRDAEGWRHWVWRRLPGHGQLPALNTPGRAKPLLDLWRGEVRRGEDTAPVSDPTRRSLDWAVRKYVDDAAIAHWPSLD